MRHFKVRLTEEEIKEQVFAAVTRKYCERCGTYDDISYGPDPFSQEIHNDDTPCWLCKECSYQSAMDI